MAHKSKRRPAKTKRRREKLTKRTGGLTAKEFSVKNRKARLEVKRVKNVRRGRVGHLVA